MSPSLPTKPPPPAEPRQAIPLGPFVLHDIVGKGGMGEVWRGLHTRQQVPVAVKVMTSKLAQNPRFVSAFQREVQTIARLNHPGIIMVLDVGEVARDVEDASAGQILAGAPYLAMECADGGGLGAAMWGNPLGWAEARAILFDMLDALAHAHARGIVHLDFKPDNILWCEDHHDGGRWKLTDFGIAHAVDNARQGTVEQAAGTPAYMAPEQFLGLFRDYGPWTDLYALGCMAWQMVTGEVPFAIKDFQQLANLHIHVEPGAFKPRCPVPDGFHGWLLRLLQKNPATRFQRAADAAFALERLGDPEGFSRKDIAQPQEATSLIRMSDLLQAAQAREARAPLGTGAHRVPDTPLPSPPQAARHRVLDADEQPATVIAALPELPPAPAAAVPSLAIAPPIPPSWRRPSEASRARDLIGAGLGLFGLRSVPMVGRQDERDAIWRGLIDVDRTQRARLIVLHGAAGAGKSRLAEWSAERAHEVGAAAPLRATHSPNTGPTDGLPRLTARHLRCLGLDYPQTLERVERLLREQGVTESWEWEALTDLIAEAIEAERPDHHAHASTPRERHALIRRLIERTARQRAAILWLDDAQFSLDSLSFTRDLLQAQALHPAPILVLMTVQAEALAQRPDADRLLRELLTLPRTERIDVEPLSRNHTEELVKRLLGLEAPLAAQVTDRAHGNPLLAVQLISEWIQRDMLEVGTSGYRLKPQTTQGPLAHDVHHIWGRRLERLLDSRDSADRVGVELAAVLGVEVTGAEWHAACHFAGLQPSRDLVHTLVAAGLARWTEDGWAFAHGLLRDAALELAQSSGRAAACHLACAHMLQHQRATTPQRALAERIARHLLAAGELAPAIPPLQIAIEERFEAGELLHTEHLLDTLEDVMRELQLPADAPTWPDAWARRAEMLRRRGLCTEAIPWIEQATQLASTWNHPQQLAAALQIHGLLFFDLGKYVHAEEHYRRALHLHQQRQDHAGIARCLVGLGHVEQRRGHNEPAAQLFQRAHQTYQQINDLSGAVMALYGYATVQPHLGNNEIAVKLFTECLQLAEHLGNAPMAINCLNGIAEVERAQGNLDAAEARYRRVLALYESMGSANATIARINIALVLLSRRRFHDARPLLERAREEAVKSGRDALLGGVYAELLPCCAAQEDWSAWDLCLKQASILLATSGAADPDDAWPAQLGAEIAASRAQHRRARMAFSLARQLWARLGRGDKIDLIDRQLALLPA